MTFHTFELFFQRKKEENKSDCWLAVAKSAVCGRRVGDATEAGILNSGETPTDDPPKLPPGIINNFWGFFPSPLAAQKSPAGM